VSCFPNLVSVVRRFIFPIPCDTYQFEFAGVTWDQPVCTAFKLALIAMYGSAFGFVFWTCRRHARMDWAKTMGWMAVTGFGAPVVVTHFKAVNGVDGGGEKAVAVMNGDKKTD